jgi:amidohydrolase
VSPIADEIVAWRRHLHAHPELSFQEHETARFVEERLSALDGLELSRPTATSVVARLRCGEGPALALRADMDALAIQEESGVEFASTRPGVMHACGHDGHTAVLLGVAHTLVERRDELAGEVRFLFQHAEEIPPGGARELVAAGALEGVDAVVGCHLFAQVESGAVGVPLGPFLAAPDTFGITVRGRGGHAALPHGAVDPIPVAAQLVTSLQQIVARETSPLASAVVSVTRFNAGTADNVIPETVELRGTVRTFTHDVKSTVRGALERIATGIAAAHGCTAEVRYEDGYLAVENDPAVAELVRRNVDPQRLQEVEPIMGGEDFSAYQQVAPGCFFVVGAGGPERFPHHHPRFTIDEEALAVAHDVFVRTALDFLGSPGR